MVSFQLVSLLSMRYPFKTVTAMLTRYALCLVPSSRAPPARQVPLVVAPAAAAAAALVPVPATGQHQFSQYPVSSDKLRSNIPGKKQQMHVETQTLCNHHGKIQLSYLEISSLDIFLAFSPTSGSEDGLEGALATGSCSVAGKQHGYHCLAHHHEVATQIYAR